MSELVLLQHGKGTAIENEEEGRTGEMRGTAGRLVQKEVCGREKRWLFQGGAASSIRGSLER